MILQLPGEYIWFPPAKCHGFFMKFCSYNLQQMQEKRQLIVHLWKRTPVEYDAVIKNSVCIILCIVVLFNIPHINIYPQHKYLAAVCSKANLSLTCLIFTNAQCLLKALHRMKCQRVVFEEAHYTSESSSVGAAQSVKLLIYTVLYASY